MSSPRLIATLGPSSFEHAEALVQAGASEFRLNASHLTPEQVRERLLQLRAVLPEFPCVIDLQGKKMRVGQLEPRRLDLGDRVVLSDAPGDPSRIFVPHPELFEQLSIGESLSLDDHRIELEIVERITHGVIAVVTRPGILQSRKGINRPCHPIELRDLPEHDQTTIGLCSEIDAISFAVSFANDGSEAGWVRRRAPHCPVILKVERSEALKELSQLARNADQLWICRGDLGAQLGLIRMAREVAEIQPLSHAVPILMAGQVLQHLFEHAEPTRSEVCHLHDLLARGYAGIVLSDETAIGHAPIAAVRWAAQLMSGTVLRAP